MVLVFIGSLEVFFLKWIARVRFFFEVYWIA
jgi:hypothetical protein